MMNAEELAKQVCDRLGVTVQIGGDRNREFLAAFAAAAASSVPSHTALTELVEALDATNWSSWQTTARFWPALEAARAVLAASPPHTAAPDLPQCVLDLIAVLNRDGGHYLDEHGLEAACKRAKERYYEVVTQADPAAQADGEVVIGDKPGLTEGWHVIKWREDLPPLAVGTRVYLAASPPHTAVADWRSEAVKWLRRKDSEGNTGWGNPGHWASVFAELLEAEQEAAPFGAEPWDVPNKFGDRLTPLGKEICRGLASLASHTAAQAVPAGWISVEERLPTEKAEYVHRLLVVNRYGSQDVATYDGYAKYFEMGSTSKLGGHEVTHWMPLPAAPVQAEAPTEEKS